MKSGFVAVLGRPNVGKSTLVNELVGSKIAIVSSKPQTTRDAIQGIVTRPEGQIVFVDSPGIHTGKGELGKRMMREIERAASGCHAVLFVVDAARENPNRDRDAIRRLERIDAPVLLVMNKIDRLPDKRALLPLIAAYQELFDFAEFVPISARSGDGIDLLVKLIFDRLPEAPAFYPEDYITDQPERFLAAELIRERVLQETKQEVPHSAAIAIEKWEESPRLLKLSAVLYVERDGQKGIIIGDKGSRLKQIGIGARESLEDRFGKKVFLEVFVKVKPHWREKAGFMKTLDEHRYGAAEGWVDEDDDGPEVFLDDEDDSLT